MDLMGYADDATRMELATIGVGLASRRQDLSEAEFADQHILNQQAVQLNQFKLANDLMGLKDRAVENEAFKRFDPNNPKSLDLVIDYLAQNGDGPGAMKVIGEKNKQQMLGVDYLSKLSTMQTNRDKRVAQIASGMNDPDSYQAGINQMRNEGVDPAAYGFTPDATAGLARAKQVAQAGISLDAKARIAAQAEREDRLWAGMQERWKESDRRANIAERHLDLEDARLSLMRTESQARAAAQQRRQSGQEQKDANSVIQYGRQMRSSLEKTAAAAIAADEDMSKLSPERQSLLAKQIAGKVIADGTKGVTEVSQLPSDWDERVVDQVVEAAKNPANKPAGVLDKIGNYFSGKKQPLPQASGKVTPVAVQPKSKYQINQLVPYGPGKLKVIGFDSKGEPLFESETGPDGKEHPKFYK